MTKCHTRVLLINGIIPEQRIKLMTMIDSNTLYWYAYQRHGVMVFSLGSRTRRSYVEFLDRRSVVEHTKSTRIEPFNCITFFKWLLINLIMYRPSIYTHLRNRIFRMMKLWSSLSSQKMTQIQWVLHQFLKLSLLHSEKCYQNRNQELLFQISLHNLQQSFRFLLNSLES